MIQEGNLNSIFEEVEAEAAEEVEDKVEPNTEWQRAFRDHQKKDVVKKGQEPEESDGKTDI